MSIQTVSVLGAGTMGHGIAQVAAQAGLSVILEDVSAELVNGGIKQIKLNLEKGIERGKVTAEEMNATLSRIYCATNLNEATRATDLVIEAIVEKLDIKRELFEKLDRLCSPRIILASNTSSLSIQSIAEFTKRPDRVIGMHFFNPPHIMKVIEVVVAPDTSKETLGSVLDLCARFGKEAITVKDSPGFATSRLGVALGLEAMRMLEEGVASAEDIDKAMVLGYNHPMGPLRLTDLVGLDIRLNVAEYLFEKLGTERFRPPSILKQKVAEGKLGKKTGEGFYSW
jgi:3-hydroxybutyryl-CoA dehydrogenase